MDPLFVKPFEPPKRHWVITVFVLAVLRWIGRTLISRPLAVYRPGQESRVFRPMHEFMRAAAYQALFLPMALSLTAALLVYIGTHPALPTISLDPAAQGIYFDQVNLTSEDGTALSAWFAPVVDARRVLAQKERIIRTKDPAIVLVHDFGQSPQQLLPLVAPLHEEGLAVMVVGLRGVGAAKVAGQTFGLNESADVRAAVDYLRRCVQVDGTRIAVLGVGTGATAALLAAQHDPAIKALIVADPVKDADQVIDRRVAPRQAWVKWMKPMCKWAFEICYHVTADDMRLDRLTAVSQTRPTLSLPPGSESTEYFSKKMIARVQWFVHQQLRSPDAMASGK
jgi:dienelactone hydrolase